MIVEPSEHDLPISQTRDKTLVEAHCNGDPHAFPEIVADHYRALLAQSERRLGRGGDAEDAVQETFERAFRALCRFGGRGEYRLGAWLSRILVNVCNDHGGRAAVERGLPDRMAGREVPNEDAFEAVSDPLVLRAVREAIDALPSSQRDTFLLKEMDGLSYPQVAEHLDITEDNARARVHRAKSALKRSLAVTRTALGAVVAIPVGLRSLFRRGLVAPDAGPELTAAPSSASNLATQVATSPVGQAVVALAPSGGLRGSIVAGIAGLAVTGALAVPAVTSGGSSSQPTPPGERTSQSASVQAATPTTVAEHAADPGQDSTAAVTTLPEAPTAPSTTMEAPKDRVDWWNDDAYRAPLEGAPIGDPPLGTVTPCPTSDAVASALTESPTRVVSRLDLSFTRLDRTERGYSFTEKTKLASNNAPLVVTGDVCVVDGRNTALDMRLSVDGAGTVHLTGTSVYDQGGVWLFRGIASAESGGFGWATDRFIAKFEAAQLSGSTLAATISVAFQSDAAHVGGGKNDWPLQINVISPPPGSTTPDPAKDDDGTDGTPGDPATDPPDEEAGDGDGSTPSPTTTTTSPPPPTTTLPPSTPASQGGAGG